VTIDSLRMGGAETMLVNLVNHFDYSKFSTTIVSLSADNPLAKRIKPFATQVISVPRQHKYDLCPVHTIRHLILECGIHCVLCFDFFDYFFVKLALTSLQMIQPCVLVSMHQTLPDSTKDFLKTFFYARFLTNSVHIVTVCNHQAYKLSRIYCIPRQQFQTIYNGVDTEYFSPTQIKETKAEIRQHFSLDQDGFVILQVANFSLVKRHEDSLWALKWLLAHRPGSKVTLILIGSGTPCRETRLKEIVAQMKLEKNVLFLGMKEDLRPFYYMADCFTLSSYSESFPMAALEALAMGLPCVLTDVGGAREMMREGIDGFIVPACRPEKLAEAWSKVWERPDKWSSTAIRSYTVDNFSIEKCALQYEQLIMGSVK